MPRVPLYSRSPRAGSPGRPPGAAASEAPAAPTVPPAAPALPSPGEVEAPAHPRTRRQRLRATLARWQAPLWALGGALVVGGAVLTHGWLAPRAHDLTQKELDAAVLHTLDNNVLPSASAKAFAAIAPSVVHVRGLHKLDAAELAAMKAERAAAERAAGALAPKGAQHAAPRHPPAGHDDSDVPEGYSVGVGSGVVIIDNGTILTNLHVVAGADSITVAFYEGTESPADVISVQPENDLAVLKARKIPDDLPAATLRSTTDLNIGDEVVAVGFPFDIGPSASDGIVSGLKREYRSPEGKRKLTNLIQFDAAANPGNSGGPLVTMDGAVVGIVTGIYNPTEQRVFIGIGFAVPIENAASAVGLSPF
ncbi:MAG: trypsin-like peptidase domain-containing protein [Proteobacteria bacterium]|nr:trypsin-like peptidase domain-containing protein [Pseudomonadota bacterium]